MILMRISTQYYKYFERDNVEKFLNNFQESKMEILTQAINNRII